MRDETAQLRAGLDERGVKYDTRDSKDIKKTMESTYWDDPDGRRWGYMSDESGAIKDRQLLLIRGRMDFTPAQAIAATLGPRTCRKLPSSGETRCFVSRNGCEMEFGYWKCSNCGAECFEGAKYCTNCGAKAVDE